MENSNHKIGRKAEKNAYLLSFGGKQTEHNPEKTSTGRFSSDEQNCLNNKDEYSRSECNQQRDVDL